jgi:hypothetical protein
MAEDFTRPVKTADMQFDQIAHYRQKRAKRELGEIVNSLKIPIDRYGLKKT